MPLFILADCTILQISGLAPKSEYEVSVFIKTPQGVLASLPVRLCTPERSASPPSSVEGDHVDTSSIETAAAVAAVRPPLSPYELLQAEVETHVRYGTNINMQTDAGLQRQYTKELASAVKKARKDHQKQESAMRAELALLQNVMQKEEVKERREWQRNSSLQEAIKQAECTKGGSKGSVCHFR